MSTLRKTIYYPSLILKNVLYKFKPGGFIKGTVFGALFALAVNIVTMQTQEMINQQLYLESLELEIAGHFVDSYNISNEFQDLKVDESIPNYYFYPSIYESRVWNSGEGLRYIVKLPPEIQALLMSYYDHTVFGHNKRKQMDYDLMREKILVNCFFEDYYKLSSEDQENCRHGYYEYMRRETLEAGKLLDDSGNLLNYFQPTKQRLNNPVLKFLLGNKVLDFLENREQWIPLDPERALSVDDLKK